MTDIHADLSELSDAAAAALLLAVDPAGLGGIVVHAWAGPIRDRWLAQLRDLLPEQTPWRRLPLGTSDARVFGGLDLAATLAAGKPVAERGLLAETDGGVLLLSMAERISNATAARLSTILDCGVVTLERDGLSDSAPALVGMVALDEGLDADERLPAVLVERLAFLVDLENFDPSNAIADGPFIVADARLLYPTVVTSDAILTVLSETALALGVMSLRASLLAVRAARAAAALRGQSVVAEIDAALAARLVLAPRATRLPSDQEAQQQDATAPASDAAREPKKEPRPDQAKEDGQDPENESRSEEPLGDLVLSAAKASIPQGLLLRLQAAAAMRGARQTPGRAGALQQSAKRGRPAGVRRGSPTGGARLNVIETLRTAAPWQKLRVRMTATTDASPRRIEIRRDDLRVTRFKQRTETTTIFVVDASGSLALNRLAEAKGAVELLLAECYVRRDQVALLAFRGRGAELLLPPTRSLARAKRCLAELPGGGATPLASAIDTAVAVATKIRQRGRTPVVVFLTDGRANVARDGSTGRARAEDDVRSAAQAASATGIRMLVVDAAQRPQPSAQALAKTMGAIYLPLPRAEASSLSRAIQTAIAV